MNRSQYITQVLRKELATGGTSMSILAEGAVVNGDVINGHKHTHTVRYSIPRKTKK